MDRRPPPARDATLPWLPPAAAQTAAEPSPGPRPPAAPGPAPRRFARLRDGGEIARGSMGSIRLMFDPELRRRVALKLMAPAFADDPSMRQRFIDEARVTGALDHPNVVPVYELDVPEGRRAAYTMKLVEGRPLTTLIAAQRTHRDLERILQVLISACDALSFAHSQGIVHRDLKPDNIMVGDFGQVYVMDWGAALVRGDRRLVDSPPDERGTVIGTVQYMAPEQARGETDRVDARTDVFSLGAILYKTLTGRPAYAGPPEQALELARRGLWRPIDEAGGHGLRPPPTLMRIVEKAMAYQRSQRHAGAAEFAEALRAFLRSGDWFPQQRFAAGSVIVREGEAAQAAYIVTAGHCRVVRQEAGQTRVLRELSAGEVFGETAIFAGTPRSASVVAVDEVTAVVVDRASLDGLLADSYLGKFVKALAGRFLELDAQAAGGRARTDIELPD